MTLRERLAMRYGNKVDEHKALNVPAVGHIGDEMVLAIHESAIQAQGGDIAARDQLFLSLQPRLERISNSLRPRPNTPEMIGIWDRHDVHQDGWIVYVELLAGWNQSINFVPYLFSRFAWRLRDRILRGIGKSSEKFGTIRIPEFLLTELLEADDTDQPESVAMARALLEELLQQYAEGNKTSGEVEAWFGLIGNSEKTALVSPGASRKGRASGKSSRVA